MNAGHAAASDVLVLFEIKLCCSDVWQQTCVHIPKGFGVEGLHLIPAAEGGLRLCEKRAVACCWFLTSSLYVRASAFNMEGIAANVT